MRCCRTAVRLVRTLITCTILLLPSSARPLPPRRRLAAISTAAFAVLAPFPCWSSPSAAAVAVNVVGTIEPGYQLPPEQYASYATLLARQDIDVVPTPTTDGASIEEDANAAKNALGRGGRTTVKLLVGHSRGGAVAALAAAAAATAAAADAPAPFLALLDPVDTADGATLRALESARRGPARVLLVSLPYGGYSAYYKTEYESACAPAGRNGEAFYRAYAAALPPNHVLHVTVRNAGHLQLLDRYSKHDPPWTTSHRTNNTSRIVARAPQPHHVPVCSDVRGQRGRQRHGRARVRAGGAHGVAAGRRVDRRHGGARRHTAAGRGNVPATASHVRGQSMNIFRMCLCI